MPFAVSTEHHSDERESISSPEALKIKIVGGANEVADVLLAFKGRQMLPVNYSVVPGEIIGTFYLTMVVPPRDPSSTRRNPQDNPTAFLATMPSVIEVIDATEPLRRHMRLVANTNHPDAGILRCAIEQLGGSAQGKLRDKLKLTADTMVLDSIASICRSVQGIVHQGKINSPFTTVMTDTPTPIQEDARGGPNAAPEAVRHVLNIQCWPEFQDDREDKNILKILSTHQFSIASVGSRMREDNKGVQEITIMLHGGSSAALQKALAEIWRLAGVIRARCIREEHSTQYVQVAFPMSAKWEMPHFLKAHKGLHTRDKITERCQIVVTGSLPLYEAARVWKDLAGTTVGMRPNAAICLTNNGEPFVPPETRGLEDDMEFNKLVRDIAIRDLRGLIALETQQDAIRA